MLLLTVVSSSRILHPWAGMESGRAPGFVFDKPESSPQRKISALMFIFGGPESMCLGLWLAFGLQKQDLTCFIQNYIQNDNEYF